KWGLVPTPQIRGLGQTKGTEARYPVGTAALVIDLKTTLDEKRSRWYAGWTLWAEGHDVSSFFRSEMERWADAIADWQDGFEASIDEGCGFRYFCAGCSGYSAPGGGGRC